MFTVSDLWRYPIKSHGRESIDTVELTAGQTMPWDRHWAVTHGDSKFDAESPAWMMCRNFMIGASSPSLAGISAELDEKNEALTLRHTKLGELIFWPDNAQDQARFLDWVRPLCPADQRQPVGLVAAPNRGMTDTDYPTLSIVTNASHRAVEGRIGRPLERERWRGNIWLDGPSLWEEFEWIGKRIQIGGAVLEVIEPIQRCKHTMANPLSGVRDTDTLAALNEGFGHQDFGVYATVVESGNVSCGDTAKVI